MSRISKRFYRVDSIHGLDFLDRGETAGVENRWVFEISHEAANKGECKVKLYGGVGIHTQVNRLLSHTFFNIFQPLSFSMTR